MSSYSLLFRRWLKERSQWGVTMVALWVCLLWTTPLRATSTDNYRQWAHWPSETLLTKGIQYRDTTVNMADSALVCFSIVANRYYEGKQSLDEVRNSIKAMISMGCMYYYLYFDYEKALYYLNEALQVAGSHGQTDMVANIHYDLANLYTVYAQIGRANAPAAYQEALRYFRMAYKEACGSNMLTVKLNTILAFCDYAITTGQIDEVIADVQPFDTIECDFSLPKYQYARCIRQAVGFLHEGNAQEALASLDRSVEHARHVSNADALFTRMFSTVCALKAHILARMNKYDKAISELKKAEQMLTYDAKDIKVDLCRLLYLFNKEVGNTAESDKYHLAYYQQKDSILLNDKLGDIKELEFRNNLEQANDEIRQMTKRAQWQWMITITVVIVALVILTMLVMLWRNYRSIHAKNQVLYQKSLESLSSTATAKNMTNKYSSSPLDQHTKEELMLRVRTVMDQPEVICMPDFTVALLAEKVNTKPRHVSQVINEHYEKGFNQMLSEYRIKEACRRLVDTQGYGNLSIEGLSAGLGFKSRSNFVSNFKRIVGMSPSEYKNQSKLG